MSEVTVTAKDTPTPRKQMTAASLTMLNAKLACSTRLPDKLMHILLTKEAPDAIWWLPRGDAFIIQKEKFQDAILLKYFRGNKFKSLVRNMHRWGFKRMTSDVEPLGKTVAFSHALFLKDETDLVLQINMVTDARERKKEQETRKTQSMKRTAEEALASDVSAKKVAKRADATVLGVASFQAEVNACKYLEFPSAQQLFPSGRVMKVQAGSLDGPWEMASSSPLLLRILDNKRRAMQSSLLMEEATGVGRAMGAGSGAAGLPIGSNSPVGDSSFLRSLSSGWAANDHFAGLQPDQRLLRSPAPQQGSTLARDMLLMRRGLSGVSTFLPNSAVAGSFRQQRTMDLGLDHLLPRLQHRHLELLQLQNHAAQARNLSMNAMLSSNNRTDSLFSYNQNTQNASGDKR